MNYVVDFSDKLSKLTLSEHPNSLFMFHSEALENQHGITVMPSELGDTEIIDGGSSNKTFRHNRSSSSGFSVVERELGTFTQTSNVDEVKCEAFSERPSRCRVINQSLDAMQSSYSSSQPKSKEHNSPLVKSWASVLATGKTAKQPTLASVVRGNQNDQTKLSKCSSVRSLPVNHPRGLKVDAYSQADKFKYRLASRDIDRMQSLPSDGNGNRRKSHDRVSLGNEENHSAGWVTIHDKKTKPRSQTPQPRTDAATHLAGSCMTEKSKQDKKGEIAGVIDSSAASSSQSKAPKQTKKKKKKKKQKSEGSDIVHDKTSVAVEERREHAILPLPEFHNVNEFPSLFSSKSVSKKTVLQTSMPIFPSGIFTF